jgi:tRNA(Leu) C34 or U34 (ribose-2'-O)-methylase TrmL
MTHNYMKDGPKIALFEPDIPQNTAAIIRTHRAMWVFIK